MEKKIRALLVDDSPVARRLLRMLLESDREIEVVGEAGNGADAVRMVAALNPSIVTMDLKMPVMDGFSAIEEIMKTHPVPIIVVTSSYHGKNSHQAFEAMSRGALDVMQKPNISAGIEKDDEGKSLIEKVKLLSLVRVRKRTAAPARSGISDIEQIVSPAGARYEILAVTSSTGGPAALHVFLSALPENFPAGIVIVQHIADGFEYGMVEWMKSTCKINIKVAEQEEEIKAGTALVCPSGRHIKVASRRFTVLSDEPPVRSHIPSGDILFSSVASVYGHRGIGLIMTGMGMDGAEGLKKMKDAGAYTIAQDEKSSVIFGMPKAAIELGAVSQVAPLERIADIVSGLVRYAS